GTGEVRADLDQRSPDRLEVKLLVERGDRLTVGGREVERVGHLAQRLRGEPPVPLLGEPQRGQNGRAWVRVRCGELSDLVVEDAHSPVRSPAAEATDNPAPTGVRSTLIGRLLP